MFCRSVILCLLNYITENIQVTEGFLTFRRGQQVGLPWYRRCLHTYVYKGFNFVHGATDISFYFVLKIGTSSQLALQHHLHYYPRCVGRIILNAEWINRSINRRATWCKISCLYASGGSKQAWHVPDAVYTVLELLMMGGETARNM
jgi:hypothetical protein